MYTPRGTLDRDSVIERYGKMVRRVAVQMAARLPSSIELDDLIQAGLIGLVDAVSRFDAAMGVQFDTFAMQRVRGAMLDELRNADWMPRSVRKSQRSIEQAIHAVEQRLGRPAQEREIADELQVPLEEYQRLLSSAKGSQLLYFEDSASEDDDESRIEQMLPDDAPTPDRRLEDTRFRESLVAAIDGLPEREKLLMYLYYVEGDRRGAGRDRVSCLAAAQPGRCAVAGEAWGLDVNGACVAVLRHATDSQGACGSEWFCTKTGQGDCGIYLLTTASGNGFVGRYLRPLGLSACGWRKSGKVTFHWAHTFQRSRPHQSDTRREPKRTGSGCPHRRFLEAKRTA